MPLVLCNRATFLVTFALLFLTTSLVRAQRGYPEGKSWLKWGNKHREAYVVAFVEGYYDGYANGCSEGTRSASIGSTQSGQQLPYQACIDRKRDLTRGIGLARIVTQFYRQYPENRNLFIREVLDEIGKGKSLSEIHSSPPYPPLNR
jgi:hypothetical protein